MLPADFFLDGNFAETLIQPRLLLQSPPPPRSVTPTPSEPRRQRHPHLQRRQPLTGALKAPNTYSSLSRCWVTVDWTPQTPALSPQCRPQPLLSLSLLFLTASLSASHTKRPSRRRRCASTENLRARVTRWSHLPPFIIIK
ncbi:hypothetical protein PIB30_025717 [Stylosanthes scabra]|uniref:Uncharacterized protein n=1 Tax=Stylosanthes scabra TaxID=79078 RepID=A0ABU6Z715_9FABA|nr:hypothetical protein [Stylosanthes scabra]